MLKFQRKGFIGERYLGQKKKKKKLQCYKWALEKWNGEIGHHITFSIEIFDKITSEMGVFRQKGVGRA